MKWVFLFKGEIEISSLMLYIRWMLETEKYPFKFDTLTEYPFKFHTLNLIPICCKDMIQHKFLVLPVEIH